MSDLTFDEIREKLNKVLRFGVFTTNAEQYVTGLFEVVIQRAEAANARVAELEEVNMQLSKNILPRLEAAEAKLDAQQWRPGATAPDKPGWYQVFYEQDGAFTYRFYSDDGWWSDPPPSYWLPISPLPPAPQEPTP